MPAMNLKVSLIKCFLIALGILFSASVFGGEKKVAVSENDYSYTLDNGVIDAQVSKHSGDLLSLKYQGLEMLDTVSENEPGYWSHNTARGQPTARITIDPRTNGGRRAEVSVKGTSNGNQMGSGPGGSVVADIEIRYTLARGDSGLYTYSILSHTTNYPATGLGEARFCLKLNDSLFDWMTVDSNRNLEMITAYDWDHGTRMNMKEARRMNTGIYKGEVEHKYDYSANQFTVRTWGWQSSAHHLGLWFINPSVEYLSGGPTKFELSAHRDATFTDSLVAPAPPTLLNYWRSSHYGGSMCGIAATDTWTKVVGPFLIYCDSGATRDAAWQNALAREKVEAKAWPYNWVASVDYPHKKQRATVTGKIVLYDPGAPGLIISNLLVGLAVPDYTPPPPPPFRGRGWFGGFGFAGGGEDDTNSVSAIDGRNNFNTNSTAALGTNSVADGRTNRFGRFGRRGFGGFGGRFGPRIVEWQNDAKHYEFWVKGDAKGNFSIPNVRAGTYTLHAIADGVLGELALSNVMIKVGQKVNLGTLDWQPIRYGRQLWDIGIPNRTASEFLAGNDYFHWGWYLKYPKLFPNDVNYQIGKSDFHKDWFIEQVPHDENTNNITGTGRGRATTWTVGFNLPEAPHGTATLRLAICGVSAREIAATINDKPMGAVTNLMYNATIDRDGIGGSWCERDLVFDGTMMKAGENSLKLTVPSGGLTSGIMYDYLRLELNEGAAAKAN
jgi:rhamnogalacturonan endolyase